MSQGKDKKCTMEDEAYKNEYILQCESEKKHRKHEIQIQKHN